MSEQINVTVHPNADGEIVIKHLTGKLLDPVPEKKHLNIGFIGNVEAVSDFLVHRTALIDKLLAVVTIDHAKLLVQLDTNPNFEESDKVTGIIEVNPDLLKFKINEAGCNQSRPNFLSFLRTNRQYFSNKDQHGVLMSEISNLEVKVELDLKHTAAGRGTSTNLSDKKITLREAIPFTTMLYISVFRGEEPKKISVDICYDASERDLIFWFESTELSEIMYDATIIRLAAEKKKIQDLGILVLER